MKQLVYLSKIILNGRIHYTIMLLLIFQYFGYTQKIENFNIVQDDIELILPPLEALIDSAIANSPTIKYSDLQTNIKEYKLKSDQLLWTKNIGIQTDIRYGTFDTFSTNTSEGQSPSIIATRNNQTNYGIGAYVKIPIYDVVTRKKMIQTDQIEIEQAQNFSIIQRNELRQTVIKQYNDLILKYRVFIIKLKNVETSKINMQLIEKGFSNGVIPITEYANQSEAFSNTEIDLESSRIEFKTAYMIFEETIGIKLNFITIIK